MSRLITSAAILTMLTAGTLSAQDAGFWSRIEVGATASAGMSVTEGVGREAAVPWSLRVAYVTPNSPWGVEFSTEFRGSRTVAGRQFSEFGVPISVVRSIGGRWGAKGVSGMYTSLGYSGRTVAARADTAGATIEGVVLAVGTRVTIGRSTSVRLESVLLIDHGRLKNSVWYPGVARSTIRLGIASYYPQFW